MLSRRYLPYVVQVKLSMEAVNGKNLSMEAVSGKIKLANKKFTLVNILPYNNFM